MIYKAVGIHVFAGGFTHGVKAIMDIPCQLETHDFGRETCVEVFDTPFINDVDANWPHVEAQMAFGNPRCTGFSTITGGYGESTHGAWAKQTLDIHQLCDYAVDRYDIVIWESVQGAFTTGRPLLDYLRDEIFAPKHYRVAHILLNASSFGNAQQRRRYFFVAYRDDRNFNVVPPVINYHYGVAYDVLWDLRTRETNEQKLREKGVSYDFDSYQELTPGEKHVLPNLPNGWNMNRMGRYGYAHLSERQKRVWNRRISDMPFSMHCVTRLQWLRPFPTIHSSAARFIHPSLDRPMTVGELSTAMGWKNKIPVGRCPAAQIAKGVVPIVGTWLAEQAKLYLDGTWGDEDWESRYDSNKEEWMGRSVAGSREKVFDLTKYVGHLFDRDRYEVEDLFRCRSHVDLHRQSSSRS